MATYKLKSDFAIPGIPDYPAIKAGTIIEGKAITLPTLQIPGISYYYVVSGRNAVAAEIPLPALTKISETNQSSGGAKILGNVDIRLKYLIGTLFLFVIITISYMAFKKKKIVIKQ